MSRSRVRWLLAAAVILASAGCSKRRPAPAKAAARPVARPAARPESPTAPQWLAEAPAPAPAVEEAQPPANSVPMLLAAPAAPEPDLVDSAWADAKVDQFATYRGTGGTTITYKVIAVSDATITVRVAWAAGEAKTSREMSFPRKVPAGQSLLSVPRSAEWTEETLTVAGKVVPCRVTTWRKMVGPRLVSTTMWLSDRVPGRLVRTARQHGDAALEVTMDLTDFGPWAVPAQPDAPTNPGRRAREGL